VCLQLHGMCYGIMEVKITTGNSWCFVALGSEVFVFVRFFRRLEEARLCLASKLIKTSCASNFLLHGI
jgi:hypothetical protein